ncbi:MAG: threonine synthase [Acidobacteriota bacterium]|nr:threonine synthase [Acidobacteriota bacterium]
MYVTHLECSKTGKTNEPNKLYNLSEAGKPLLVRYDLKRAAETLTKDILKTRVSSLWRYREVLPVVSDENIVSLGEGWTPLVHARRLGAQLGSAQLFIKDEGANPTGSFKARGQTTAISMAKELGVRKVAIPTAGNAGGAMAAYAAAAGLEAYVFMPRDTPAANRIECQQLGAHLTLIDGLITDCGAEIARRKDAEGWFDVSTLKEPYRIEGKKTMGYELAEQFDWELPDVILYPTGGGTGLVGMWKAFDEMEKMGWIGKQRPRMFSVQAAGCAPIVRAFENGWDEAPEFENAHTVASGLRVPRAIGDFIMLDILRSSGGSAVSVTDEEMIADTKVVGAAEGLFCAPEGAACFSALKKLLASGQVAAADRVVLFNTGTGVKYLEAYGLKEAR